MIAVIKTGGKQYKVSPKSKIKIEKITFKCCLFCVPEVLLLKVEETRFPQWTCSWSRMIRQLPEASKCSWRRKNIAVVPPHPALKVWRWPRTPATTLSFSTSCCPIWTDFRCRMRRARNSWMCLISLLERISQPSMLSRAGGRGRYAQSARCRRWFP